MKITILLWLLAATCSAVTCINAGGGATNVCGADQFFAGGAAWGPDQQAGLALETLRYGVNGAAFSYNIPVAPGAYQVKLSFVEPNKTAAGQRLFTVSVNGQQSPVLDVFSLAGGQQQVYVVNYFAMASVGFIQLDFKPVMGGATPGAKAVPVGNPIVSRIELTPISVVLTLPNPVQLALGLKLNTTVSPPLLSIDDSIYAPVYIGEKLKLVGPNLFQFAHPPDPATVAIYINGVRSQPQFYSLQNDRVLLTYPTPLLDGDVFADYGSAR